MRKVVEEVARYVEMGETGESLAEAEQTFGWRALRLACINLLGWLKGQANLKHQYALVLHPYPWCDTVRRLVTENRELSKIFIVDRDKVVFHPDIPMEERLEIEQFVFAHYNPRRWTSERVETS